MVFIRSYFWMLCTIKVREEGRIVTKASYVALGINAEGRKDILGIWIGENEGAKFWLKVCNELKTAE